MEHKIKAKIKLRSSTGTVRFDDISPDGSTPKTWQSYIRFITSFYPKLDLPDKELFYWEILSQESTIAKLTEIILATYQVKDGDSLAAKLSPFRSVLFKTNASVVAISRWGETIINARKNFDQIIADLGIQPIDPPVPDQTDWSEAYAKLHQVSTDASVDTRVRVLATIYKYGYLISVTTIFGTSIQSTGRHYLDLVNHRWTIKFKLQFAIPESMATELEQLTKSDVFRNGWLLPQKRGIPYATQASISSFSGWAKAGLKITSYYRGLYNIWLRSKVTEMEYLCFQRLLDLDLDPDLDQVEVITYVPPVPVP